jgi:hypothetical protein
MLALTSRLVNVFSKLQELLNECVNYIKLENALLWLRENNRDFIDDGMDFLYILEDFFQNKYNESFCIASKNGALSAGGFEMAFWSHGGDCAFSTHYHNFR